MFSPPGGTIIWTGRTVKTHGARRAVHFFEERKMTVLVVISVVVIGLLGGWAIADEFYPSDEERNDDD